MRFWSDFNAAKVFNTFFCNIVYNHNIAEYLNCESLANDISDTVLKCVIKCRNHPNILAIGEVFRNHPNVFAIGEICNKRQRLPFFFSKVNREEIPRKILKL